MNKYYILFQDETVDGPWTFKTCIKRKEVFEWAGMKVSILKLVIDVEGNEVK